MILSDRSIREELAAGRIVIEPLADGSIQPSSVDLHVDRWFRVFRNHTSRVIDVKEDQAELTELVEVGEDDAFVLHPGEFALGSTAERVALPDDLVARLEGKSSLGRLGLLIHSSLPASEPVLVLVDGRLETRPIGELVAKRLSASVVSFDPERFTVGFAPITGWYEGPPDRIFEVRLASGRSVRVTAGHNLFTLDRDGEPAKVRTGALRAGTLVAIPDSVPDPPTSDPVVDVLGLMPEEAYASAVLGGPTVARGFVDRSGLVGSALRGAGYRRVDHYRRRARLPLPALRWDRVVDVRDTGATEAIFDLEVRPAGRPVENFLAGQGGVFVSNTAGFVDAGWDGHLTLELSNVANLPITLYPGMKIGQISFLRMTTPADRPYGTGALGSKYRGQRGPTPSRYFENFRKE